MSKNTKHKLYKEYLAIVKKRDEIYDAKENLGFIELDEPIHHGYDASFVLRDDIARRSDAHVFQKLIDKYGLSAWCRDTKFESKDKGKGGKTHKIVPTFARIDERTYLALPRKDKEFFIRDYDFHNRLWYKVHLPEYYLKIKVEKSYITHRKIIDWELEKEYDFYRDKVHAMWNEFNPFHTNIQSWIKLQNRRDRTYNKVALKKNMNSVFLEGDNEDCKSWLEGWCQDSFEFTYKTRHGVRWERW